jgi:Ras-related protein Rab-1A
MGDENYDFIFKVLLLGNSDVGKSSLLLRYVDSVWSDTFVPTIGVDFKVKTIEIGGKKVKLQIWDTAGQERFRTVVSTYFRGAHGIFLIYDITNRDSFKNLENWLIEIEKNASENVLKILIGNKNDLEDERDITPDEGKAFANRNGMQFIETSAKMNTNVNEAFETLGKLMIEFNSQQNQAMTQDKKDKKVLGASSGKNLNTKKGCC